ASGSDCAAARGWFGQPPPPPLALDAWERGPYRRPPVPNLERVAVHQTRLRTPGVSLDGKGVAVGARGLVLLSSLDRLVAFLAIYPEGASLAELLRSLKVQVLKSKLGAAEVALSFAADSTDRMDHVAEVAALAEGYTFTGTSRHFVQYRDKAAPFGYDAAS